MSDNLLEIGNRCPENLRDNTIGIVIVTYNSADIISECLESLFNSRGVNIRVVVVDNNSQDETCNSVRLWASGAVPFTRPVDSPLPPHETVGKPIDYAEGATVAVAFEHEQPMLEDPFNSADRLSVALSHLAVSSAVHPARATARRARGSPALPRAAHPGESPRRPSASRYGS